MNARHKIIREMLRQMPLPEAKAILDVNLPKRESAAIYYCDCERETLDYIGEHRLKCEEPTVKKYRQSGYIKLAALYFRQN